jgi:hypothetical protein
MLRLMVVFSLLAIPMAAQAQGTGGKPQIPDCADLHKKYPKPQGMAVCLRLTKCHSGWMIGEACTRWVQPPRTR